MKLQVQFKLNLNMLIASAVFMQQGRILKRENLWKHYARALERE